MNEECIGEDVFPSPLQGGLRDVALLAAQPHDALRDPGDDRLPPPEPVV